MSFNKKAITNNVFFSTLTPKTGALTVAQKTLKSVLASFAIALLILSALTVPAVLNAAPNASGTCATGAGPADIYAARDATAAFGDKITKLNPDGSWNKAAEVDTQPQWPAIANSDSKLYSHGYVNNPFLNGVYGSTESPLPLAPTSTGEVPITNIGKGTSIISTDIAQFATGAAVDPTTGDLWVLTVATYPQFYLLRSKDGGVTWDKPIWYSLGYQIESVIVNDIAFTSDGKLIMVGGTYTVDGWRFRTYVAEEMPTVAKPFGAQSDPLNMRLQEESPAYVGLLTAGYFPSGIAVKDDNTMWISMDVGGYASAINGTYIVEYKRVGTTPNVHYEAKIIWPVQTALSNQPNPTNNIIANLASPLPPLLEGGIFDLSSCRGFVISPRTVDPVCSSVWYDRIDWATDTGVTNLDIAIGKLNTTDARIIDYDSEVRDAYGYDTAGTPNNLQDDIWSGYWYGWGLGVGNAANSFTTTEAPKKAIDSLYASPAVINPIKQWAEGDAVSKETVVKGDVTPLFFRASAVNPVDNYLYDGYADAANLGIRRREPNNVWNPGQYDIPAYVGLLSPGWVAGDFVVMDFVFDDKGHPLVMGYSFVFGGGVNIRLYEVTSPIIDTNTQLHDKPFATVKEIASSTLPLKRTDGLTDFYFEGLAIDPNGKDILIGAYPQNYNLTRPWVESTIYKVSLEGNKMIFDPANQGGDIGKIPGWVSDMGSCTALKLHDSKLNFVKSSVFTDVNADAKASVGDKITYTFKVTNSGSSGLTNVKVTDTKCSPVTNSPLAVLKPGATDSTMTCVYTITAADVAAGSVSNQATVDALSPTGPITAKSDSNDPALTGPADPTVTKFPADTTPPVAPVCTTVPNPSNGTVAAVVTCTGVEPGATLTIPGTTCVPTPADATGIVKCTETTPGILPSNPTATVKDPAGNATTAPVPYIKDTTPPAAPVCTVTSGTLKTVTCTGVEPGATLTIPGTTCVPTPAPASGIVVCTETAPGALVLPAVATVTDPAGNKVTAPVTLAPDTTAPLAPTINPTPATNTNPLIPITGTCEPGATVTLSVAGQTLTGLCSTTGTYSITPTSPLPIGTNPVTATQKDPSGNVSPLASGTVPVAAAPDTTAPLAPTINPTPATNTNPLIPITGTCEPGATVTLSVAGQTLTGPCSPTGTYTITPNSPLPIGTNPVTATQKDAAGNVSPLASSTVPVVSGADTTPPLAPTINSGPATNTNPTPTITGTCEPGATVTVLIAGQTLTGPCSATGTYAVTPTSPLPVGTNPATVTQKDAAGNVSPLASGTIPVVSGDTSAPSAPTINPIKSTDPTVTGKGEPGATIKLTDASGNPIVCTNAPVIVAADGTYSCTLVTPLPTGTKVTATQTDPAGNVSGPANTTVTDPANTGVSAAPTVNPVNTKDAVVTGKGIPGSAITVTGATCTNAPIVVAGDGSWVCKLPAPLPAGTVVGATQTEPGKSVSPVTDTKVSDAATSTPSAPVINPSNGKIVTGYGEPGATVKLTDPTGAPIPCTPSPTIVAADGTWTCTPVTPIPNGTVITATQTDPQGNVSGPVKTTIDSVPPAAPACTVTKGTPNTVTCTNVEPGATLTIPGTTCKPTPAPASGIVVCTENTPGSMPANPLASVTDPAGNVGTAVVPYTPTVADTTPPLAPTINPTPATNTNPLIPITGTCEPGATVTLSVAGQTLTGPCSPTGTYTITPNSPLPLGTNPVTATQKDPAGNVSPLASSTVPVVTAADTTPPAKPTCTATGSPAVITCTGVEPGATLTIPGATCVPTPAGANGIVVCTELAPGSVSFPVQAIVKDPFGNTTVSDPIAKPLDTTAPTAPTINPTPTTNTNPYPTITGNCEPGATVTLVVAGQTLTGPCTPTGTYAIVPTSPLPVGTNPVTATQKDLAGNVSPLTNGTVPVATPADTTPPAKPTCTAAGSPAVITCTGVEPGATLTIPGATCVPTPAGANGIVTCTELAPGSVSFPVQAIVKDPFGNTTVSDPIAKPVVTDTTPPAKPTCTAAGSPAVITCTGVEPGATVTIPGATCVPTPAGANGIVTCTELAPGAVSFPAVAVVKDPFGNTTVSDPIVKPVVATNPCVPNPNAVTCPTGDTDGDGTPNGSDIAPTDPCMPNPNANACPTADSDGDGVPNSTDLDPKNPCVPSMYSPACDLDGDGIPNGKDLDGDGDGSPDSTEVGDVNGDGIPDRYQPSVVTIDTTGGVKSTLVFEGIGECAKPMTTFASTEGAQVSQDPNYVYPWGLVGFKIKCAGTTKVTAIWPTLTKADLAIYRKAGNLIPGDNTSFGYYDLPKVDLTVNSYNAVQYILTDGVKGDDTVADGYIYDPAGPVRPQVTTPPATTDSDKDGVPDSQDPNPTDACIPYVSAAYCDLDKDGLPNMTDLDDDGDGMSDLEELQGGTDPYNKNYKPTGPVTNCTVQTPCNTGCNSTCSNMTPAPSTCNTCGQSTCGQSTCGGCCGGNSISGITNTNTVTITGGSAPMISPVYNYNNVFNSNINFTQGAITFDFSPVTNNYYTK
jgi:Bacterial Ig domain